MGQKYAAYDSGNGNLLGFYDSIDSPVPAGLSAIEITESAWMNWALHERSPMAD